MLQIFGLLALAVLAIQYVRAKSQSVDVPCVGPSGVLTSYIGAIRYVRDARSMLLEGYSKYKVFKIPDVRGWMIFVSDRRLIEEIRLAKDDELSFQDAIDNTLSLNYILGNGVADGYHIPLFRSHLTRNLPALFEPVRQEIVHASQEFIPAKSDDWTKLVLFDTLTEVICRASNRIFVESLCRDKEWTSLNIKFTFQVVVGTIALMFVPELLKPIVAKLYSPVRRTHQKAMQLLKPIIEERLRALEEHPDGWDEKPNDFLSWLLDAGEGDPHKRSLEDLANRLLIVNFGAIHTSSHTLTVVLYDLISKPEHIEPLREEIEEVVANEGWSKLSLQKMRKLDSFIRESMRCHPLRYISMTRMARKPFTFSDGTHLPKGTLVTVPAIALHLGERSIEDPEVFDGFRFARMRDDENLATRFQMVATSIDYLPFGHGKHACPGRFFAASELKTMLAHLLVNYDIKFANEAAGRPQDQIISDAHLPNSTAEVLFRKRLRIGPL